MNLDSQIDKLIPEIWQMPLMVGLIIFSTILIAFITSKLFTKAIRKYEKGDANDLTNLRFLRRGVVVVIYLVGLGFSIYLIPGLRFIAVSLLSGAGILAIAIGFASQQALGNIVSGVFIVMFKPYKITDRISLKTELNGIVEDINLRHTVIRDFQNRRIIIPNSIISNEILINSDYKESKICKWIEVGISYDSDIDLARSIIKDEIEKHPLFLDNRSEEDIKEAKELVPVKVISLGEFSVNLRGWAWTKDPADAFILGTDLLESIKKRFDREGVEIPFPYRTIVYKSDIEKGKSEVTDNEKTEAIEEGKSEVIDNKKSIVEDNSKPKH